MATQSASLETIEDFLAQKRIAMAGISRDPANFSVKLFEEFCRRGYDVVPVNPHTAEVQGRRCFARVQDIQPPVEAVLLMTSPEATESVVNDCAEAGIRRVWMYRGEAKARLAPRQSSSAGSAGFSWCRGSVRSCSGRTLRASTAFTDSSARLRDVIRGALLRGVELGRPPPPAGCTLVQQLPPKLPSAREFIPQPVRERARILLSDNDLANRQDWHLT